MGQGQRRTHQMFVWIQDLLFFYITIVREDVFFKFSLISLRITDEDEETIEQIYRTDIYECVKFGADLGPGEFQCGFIKRLLGLVEVWALLSDLWPTFHPHN